MSMGEGIFKQGTHGKSEKMEGAEIFDSISIGTRKARDNLRGTLRLRDWFVGARFLRLPIYKQAPGVSR
jgi:hypothetical protein